MLVPRVRLIPPEEEVLDLLRETGAMREGRFELPDGRQSNYYFQMPLVMRYHGNAKVLTVALSRKLRQEPEVLSALPNCALVAPSSAGIPVAFAIREALNADQILWLEKDKEKGERRFRQYFDTRGLKCILVDDLIRSGQTISEAVRVINDTGAQVIAVAALVRYKDAQLEIGDVPCHSLVEVDAKRYPPGSWPADRADEPIQKVWF